MRVLRWLTAYPWLPSVLFAALFVAVIWFGLWRDRKAGEEVQKWRRVAVRLQADSAQRADAVQRADTVFRHDTITYTRSRDVYRKVVDSIRVTDTLTVREQVIVAAADSGFARADSALHSAVVSLQARDSLIQTLGKQRQADQSLYRAQLRAQNPRVVPYVEAAVPVNNTRTLVARGGIELRLLNHFRAQTAYQMTTMDHHTESRVLVGIRYTFR